MRASLIALTFVGMIVALIALLVLLRAGCAFDPTGGVDAALAVDAMAVAPDATIDAGNLGLNAPCDPLADGCNAKLTCRPRLGGAGSCRPVGDLGPGAECEPEGDACGRRLACGGDPPAVWGWCRELCDAAGACADGRPCRPWWAGGVGFCG